MFLFIIFIILFGMILLANIFVLSNKKKYRKIKKKTWRKKIRINS